MVDDKIDISVCMITYNHEKSIAKAIEGVISQITQYKFELLIGEDASSDNTPYIVSEYAQKYPNIIRAFCRTQNMGSRENFCDILSKCRGRFVAICEGDDQWIFENKLDSQISFLEANPDYSMCVSKCIYNENGNNKAYPFCSSDAISVEDMINNGNIKRYATCTSVFRNIYANRPELMELLKVSFVGDIIMQTTMMCEGKIHYIDVEMAQYNRVIDNSGKSFSSRSVENQVTSIREAIDICKQITDHQFDAGWDKYITLFNRAVYYEKKEMLGMSKAAKYMYDSIGKKMTILLFRQLIYDYWNAKKTN